MITEGEMEEKWNTLLNRLNSTVEDNFTLSRTVGWTLPIIVILIISGGFGNTLVCVAIATNRYN